MRQQGKLLNSEGEIIAEGACELSEPTPSGCEVTMWIPSERVLMERQQGPMTLMLEDGPTLEISEERRLKFRINGSGGESSFLYKLRIAEQQRLESPPASGQSSPARL